MKYSLQFIVAIFAVLLFAACEKNDKPVDHELEYDYMTPIVLSRSEQEIVYSQNDFSLALLKVKIEDCVSSNFVMSPLGAYIDLSMIANGANGDTQSEILSVLGCNSDNIDEVNALNKRLVGELLGADSSTELSIANSLWIEEKVNVHEQFLNDNIVNYDMEMYRFDNEGEGLLSKVQSWFEKNTNGLITLEESSWEVLNPCFQEVFFANALYFKGLWQSSFDKALTSERDFHNADGSVSSPITMYATDFSFKGVYDDNGASWLSLPYGNSAFELVLILPDENVNLNEYLSSLTDADFKELNEVVSEISYKGNISLPRFAVSHAVSLNQTLRLLGLNKVFELGLADFINMTDNDFAISSLMQQCVFNVDEDGTVASSVTYNMNDIAPAQLPTKDITVDRPFAFMLRERSTRVILFLGCVNSL